jgi:hypothetical protein
VPVLRRRAPDKATDAAARRLAMVDGEWELPWGWRHGDRRSTAVGPSGGPAVAVDPAGLVTLWSGDVSIDWWIGADDRWRVPAGEATARQTLVAGAPALETAVRVPGGDAVHRCWAVPGAVVVEVENRSPSPFALAFAVRPCSPEGAGRATTIAVDGTQVVVDGAVVLVLPARPGRVALSIGAQGDVARRVFGGGAGTEDAPVRCPDGLASGAVILPLAHRASLRVVIPAPGGPAAAPASVPSIDAVVSGWAAQDRVGVRIDVPDPVLAAALDAARRALLVVDRDDLGPAEDAALVVAALGAYGRHAEADEVIRSLWAQQRTDGSFDGSDGSGAAGGPHLWTLGEGWRRRPDPELVRGLGPALSRAAGWILELAARGRLRDDAAAWAVVGAASAGAMAGEAGLATVASTLYALSVDDRLRSRPRPLALGLLDDAPATAATAGPISGRAGLDVIGTAAALRHDALGGDAAAIERLAWLLTAGGATWSWPAWVQPATGAATSPGISPAATAAFLLAARTLLVAEAAPGHAAISPVTMAAWLGRAVEVHDLPLLAGGSLSYAVRWHGERPALLWEVRGAPGPLRLTAPGYDRTFVTVEPSGDALLAVPTESP